MIDHRLLRYHSDDQGLRLLQFCRVRNSKDLHLAYRFGPEEMDKYTICGIGPTVAIDKLPDSFKLCKHCSKAKRRAVKQKKMASRVMSRFGLKSCLVGDTRRLHVAEGMDTGQGVTRFSVCGIGPTTATDLGPGDLPLCKECERFLKELEREEEL